GRGDRLDESEFGDFVRDLDGHGGAAEADEDLRGGRLNHDVRANALDALGGFAEDAGGEADDDDDQHHFHGNRHHADERTHRPVKQVAHHEMAHHGFLSSAAPPDRKSVV